MKNTFRISNNHHKEQRLIHTLRLSAMTTCGSFRFKGRTSRFQQFKISVVPHGRSGWVRFNILIVWFSTYLTGSGVKKKKKKKTLLSQLSASCLHRVDRATTSSHPAGAGYLMERTHPTKRFIQAKHRVGGVGGVPCIKGSLRPPTLSSAPSFGSMSGS